MIGRNISIIYLIPKILGTNRGRINREKQKVDYFTVIEIRKDKSLNESTDIFFGVEATLTITKISKKIETLFLFLHF